MPGGLSVPSMGPVSAPGIVMQSPLAQVTQAIGEYPQDRQKFQMQQAELDAKNMENASQKLSVLNKMISANPGTATNPQISAAVQRAFGQMGLAAPMTTVNGVQQLDMSAMQAFGPAQDFIGQNLAMLLSFPPTQRGDVISAATGQAAPQGVIDSLSKLPVRTVQSPAEAAGMLTYVRTMFGSIVKGGDVDNAMNMLNLAAVPVSQIFGITPDEFKAGFINELKPDLTAQLQRQATLMLTGAKTEDERAKAQNLLTLLPAKLDQIKTGDDLKRVMEEYYPAMAGAATSRAATSAAEAPSVEARNNAAAAASTARANDLKTGVAHLGKLETTANAAQTLYSHLQYDMQQRTTDIQTYQTAHPGADPKTDPQLKNLTQELTALQNRAHQAQASAAQAQKNYETFQTHLHNEATQPDPSSQPQGPPTVQKGNTTYYQHADGLYYTTPE